MSFELETASHPHPELDNDPILFCIATNSTTLDSSSSSSQSVQLFLFFLQNFDCLKHSLEWTVFLGLVYLLIFVFGLIGNSLVIFVVLRRPSMRSVTNIFILNLAVADLFVIVFCVPATLLANIYIPWILGELFCKTVTYIQGFSVFSSVYSLVAVSLDRCLAIQRPMRSPRGLSKSHCVFIILLIWIIALLTTLPWVFVFEITYFPETGLLPYCHETWTDPFHEKFYFLVVNLLVCYFIPLAFIIFCNVTIWQSVAERHNPQNNNSSSNNIHQMHRTTRLRVLKMLISLTSTFFICWLPLYIIMARIKFFGFAEVPQWEQELLHILIAISQLLGSCNSCMNPVLYVWLNKKFRETLRSMLPSFSFCGFDAHASCISQSTTAAAPAAETMERSLSLSAFSYNCFNNITVYNVPTTSARNARSSVFREISVTNL